MLSVAHVAPVREVVRTGTDAALSSDISTTTDTTMTVTEFVTLEILPPHDSRSATIQDFFRKVAGLQSASSGYPMRYFQDATIPATLYILAGWSDAATHQKWIESEGNKELIAEMQSKVAVKGMAHLEIDFTEIPADASHARLTIYPDGSAPEVKDEGGNIEGSPAWVGIGGSVESDGRDVYHLQVWTDGKTEQMGAKIDVASGATSDLRFIRLEY